MKSIFITPVFFFFIWGNSSFAQNTSATITCHVYDVQTDKPIVDAFIKVNALLVGKTDSSGNIFLDNIITGKYLISASANKYFSKRIDSISVRDYKNHSLEIGLKPLPIVDHFNPRLYFYEGSYQLKNESRAILDTLAKVLLEHKNLKIEFQGNSDTYECRKSDTILSYQRANAAKDYVVGLGIDNSRISVRGFGGTRPIAPDKVDGKKNMEGCKLNRRVDFKVIRSVKK